MFDGIDARIQRGDNAALAMRMCGHLATHRMRRLDNRHQLVIRELLFQTRACVGQHPARRGDLDNVGAFLDLLAHGAAAIISAIADVLAREQGHDLWRIAVHIPMPAGHADCLPGCADTRPRHIPLRNGIPQSENRIVRRADILNRREAREQRDIGEACAIKGGIDIRILERLDPLVWPILTGDVHVAVD